MNACEELVRGMVKLSGEGNVPISFQIMSKYGKIYEIKDYDLYTGLGRKQQCYRNAENVATFQNSIEDRFRYVEGYAMKEGLIPLAHAWVVDLHDGKAIDPTWEGTGAVYFGVPFETDFVNRFTLRVESYGIFENLYKLHRAMNMKRPMDVMRFLESGVIKG